jgi:hypothetical protein
MDVAFIFVLIITLSAMQAWDQHHHIDRWK